MRRFYSGGDAEVLCRADGHQPQHATYGYASSSNLEFPSPAQLPTPVPNPTHLHADEGQICRVADQGSQTSGSKTGNSLLPQGDGL